MSLWETNQTLPSIENLVRLKEIFGVAIDKIVCEEELNVPKRNCDSLDTVCGALAYAMGIEPPCHAAQRNAELVNYIDKALDGERADRVVMYNPDAIAEWIYKKYPEYLPEVIKKTNKAVYLSTVMPSVTPVCFATMYTGAQPSVHGIRKYEKPVLSIDTLFDALARAGKSLNADGYAAFGGETAEECTERIRTFIKHLEGENCERIAVFCHAGVLRRFLSHVLKSEPKRGSVLCRNCAVGIFEFDGSAWKLHSLINQN